MSQLSTGHWVNAFGTIDHIALPTRSGGWLAIMKQPGDDHLFDEIQLILAEKRTSLSTLRTGIAIFALPLSVLSVLVATSRFYDPAQVTSLLMTLLIINLALVVLGVYLIIRALKRIHHYDFLIRQIKRKHSIVAEYL